MKNSLIVKVKNTNLNVMDYQDKDIYTQLQYKEENDSYIFFCNIESIQNIMKIK